MIAVGRPRGLQDVEAAVALLPQEPEHQREIRIALAERNRRAAADAVAFLASERAAFITGSILVADGGQTRT